MRRLAALTVMVLPLGILGGCGGSDNEKLSKDERSLVETSIRKLAKPKKVQDMSCKKEGKRIYCDVLFRSGRCEQWDAALAADVGEGREGAVFQSNRPCD